MSEPRRLLDDPNPELRDLLASADRDRPSAASRERALGVLGVASTASLAPGAAAGATKAAWASVVKIVAIVTASGVMVAGAVHYLSPPAVAPAPAPVVVPATTTTEVVPVVVPAWGVTQPTETATIEPPPSAIASVTPPKPKTPSVADELAALDRATAALRDKNPKAALAALDDHDARFPKGAFGFQSDVLRIEALAQSGNMDAARTRGHAFLTAHPNAPEAARVRSLIGE